MTRSGKHYENVDGIEALSEPPPQQPASVACSPFLACVWYSILDLLVLLRGAAIVSRHISRTCRRQPDDNLTVTTGGCDVRCQNRKGGHATPPEFFRRHATVYARNDESHNYTMK